jgi:hypothetical protein
MSVLVLQFLEGRNERTWTEPIDVSGSGHLIRLLAKRFDVFEREEKRNMETWKKSLRIFGRQKQHHQGRLI